MPTREELREAAPDLAAFVDDMRAEFGPVKVTYLRVDALNFEQGVKPEPQDPAMADSTPLWKQKDEWTKQTKAILDEQKRRRRKR